MARFPLGSTSRIVHALLLVPWHLLCTYVVLSVIGRHIVTPGDRGFSGSNAQLMIGVLMIVAMWSVVLGLGLFAVGRTTPRAIGWRFDGARDVGRGLVAFFALWAIILVVLVGMGMHLGEALLAPFQGGLRTRLDFVLVGICAASTEESIYRGYMQPALEAKLGFCGALAITSIVFAASHRDFSFVGFTMKAALGLAFGIARGRGPDRSLVAPVTAHAMLWFVLGDT